MGIMSDSLLLKNMPSVADVVDNERQRKGTPQAETNSNVCASVTLFPAGTGKGSLLSVRLCWRFSQTDTSRKFNPCRLSVRLSVRLCWRELWPLWTLSCQSLKWHST